MKTELFTELECNTLTYDPYDELPAHLAEEVESQTKSFVCNVVLFDVVPDVKASYRNSELTRLVRNRITNLALNMIADCKRVTKETIDELFQHNLSLQPEEERAIIDVFKAGADQAVLYPYLRVFMSVKVIAYMHRHKLFNNVNDQKKDTFQSLLDDGIAKAIEQFDSANRKTGGLSLNYVEMSLNQYRLCNGERNAYPINISPRASRDFAAIRYKDGGKAMLYDDHIERREYRKTHNTYAEIAKEYGVTGASLRCYDECNQMLSLDAQIRTEDGKTKLSDTVFGGDGGLNNLIVNLTMEDYYADVKRKFDVDREECQRILSAVVEYKTEHDRNVKISKREIREIAAQLGVRYRIIKGILDLFGETFVDLF